MKASVQLAVLLGGAALSAGCASTSYEKAGSASTTLQKTAQDIDQGTKKIDAVMASLSGLVNHSGPDLKKQFKKFNSELDDLQALARDVSEETAAMQNERAAYFQQWDEDLARIENEEIRNRSTERKIAVAARFETVRANYAQVKTAFNPFLSDLEDIRRALSADLTADGLASVKDVVSKANQDAQPLREAFGKLSAEFKALGVSLSATTRQP